jgi:class 3 adenylate cyclase
MRGLVLRRLSIRSQLLILLLVVGLGGVMLAAGLAFTTASNVREREVIAQLASLRDAKASRIQEYFGRMSAHVEALAEDEMVLDAMKQFGAAYAALDSQPVPPEMTAALTRFYTDDFLPRVAATSGGRPELDAYFPVSNAARILQARYVAKNGQASGDPLASSTSDYARVYARFDSVLTRLAAAMGYKDIQLIAPDGNVVYSVEKEPDFGTNLPSGPYSESSLARVYTAARQQKDRGKVELADFTIFAASGNVPSAFFGVPLLEGSQLLGVLAVELSIDSVNDAMTGHRGWAHEGFGATGEAYLVGDDHLLRSDSRFLLEDKAAFLSAIVANGVPQGVADRIGQLGTSVLHQPVHTEATKEALSGQTGAGEMRDYRGVRTLTAYRPAGIPGVNWGLVAKRDFKDAMAPVIAFKRQVALFGVAFVVLVTMLSLWLAGRFVRPINALLGAVQEIGEGREDVHVDDRASDEIGRLSRAFNAMVERLREDKEAIRSKNRENEALLLNVLPAPIAQRLKGGEERIADAIPNVTVLFSDIVGFGDYSRSTNAEDVVGLLNEIVSAFDEAAERHGVERVKTIGSVYMAVCGLSVPRIDHAHRMLAFACDMDEVIHRINQRHDLRLDLSTGINSGPAIAGIVGRQKFIYDLWGDTVTLAGRMQRAASTGGIRVTDAVKDAVGDLHRFEPGGEFDVPGRGAQHIWVMKAA